MSSIHLATASATAPPRMPPSPLHATPIAREEPQRGPSVRCSTCAMRRVCIPPALSASELERVDSIVCTTRPIRKGDTLFRAGDAFQNIYVVRAGSFKTVIVHSDGREQVTGFQIAGETLGLDGVYTGRQNGDVIALEDSVVCVISFAQLETVCREIRTMQHHVHQMMSGEIVRESSLMMLLGTMSAEQRVAAFLLNLSQRFKALGYSAAEFHLRMTRREIGCYLGMKLETVSRTFSKFQREQLVDAQGKQIRILDPEGLAALI